MPKYFHSLKIASFTGQKYAYFFKKRASVLDYSNALSMNHCYKGFVGKSTKNGKFINTNIVDTPSRLVGILSTFNEKQWLGTQRPINLVTIAEGRDIFNPRVNKKPSAVKFIREPESPYLLNMNYGTQYNSIPKISYIFQSYEYNGITSQNLCNYASNAIDNVHMGDKRTRSIRYFFLNYASKTKTVNDTMADSNLWLELFENAFESQKIYFTSRYDKKAISPTIVANAFALSLDYGRFFGTTCVVEPTEPEEDDYKEGAGITQIMCGFIGKNDSFSLFLLSIEDKDFFSLETWDQNEWQKGYGSLPTEDDKGEKKGVMLGYLPNLLGEPVAVAVGNSIYLYISGVRAHYYRIEDEEAGDSDEDEDEAVETIKSQTATIKFTLNYNEQKNSLAVTGREVIEHDASGAPNNYKDLGGTDEKYWNVYHTLWAGAVGEHTVVLVNNTKYKRFKESTSQFMGDAFEDKEKDIVTDIHIYIDDKVYKYTCEELKFYPYLENESNNFPENNFDKEKADIITPLISKKFGTVISDEDILFCMTAYPDNKKSILVNFNIKDKAFKKIKEEAMTNGQHVATCYQLKTKDRPACILYRVGIQGGKGKVYLSKDTAQTWLEIGDSEYTSGGGMYYLGGDHYKIDYGNAFA